MLTYFLTSAGTENESAIGSAIGIGIVTVTVTATATMAPIDAGIVPETAP